MSPRGPLAWLGAALLILILALVGGGLAGCRPSTSAMTGLDARVGELEQANLRDDAKLDALELRAEDVVRAAAALVDRWTEVEAELDAAARRLDHAARSSGEASAAYTRARQSYEQAEQNWRLVAATLMVASLSKAGNRVLCDGQMNTAKVRRVWRKRGYDLDGLDADHIWPKSLGGANHPWNYQRLGASLNRSLGNKLGWKLVHEPLALLRGGAVSALVALQCR